MEERLNRKISNEEWKEMTKDGEVEMIGGSDGPTEIYTETK
jgi:Na+-transporting methylmalonyl-CoA/oxaloacetate decarboxylase beta subunit